MSNLLTFTMALAAGLFVALSATMNALFLSSLGRTSMESALLAVFSIAADVTKAALPIVILRAIVLRAWGHMVAAALMLLVVIALSLASGTGFAALTRGGASAARQVRADERAARTREQRDIETRLDLLVAARPESVIDADLASAVIDRRWAASQSCTIMTGPALRQFCGTLLTLKAERAAALERDRLNTDRGTVLAKLAILNATAGGPEIDPQAAALADLLGVDTATPRRVLASFTAVVIELGSVILILLVAGPALIGWRVPGSEPEPPPVPISLPQSKDVTRWQKRREAHMLAARGGDHAL